MGRTDAGLRRRQRSPPGADLPHAGCSRAAASGARAARSAARRAHPGYRRRPGAADRRAGGGGRACGGGGRYRPQRKHARSRTRARAGAWSGAVDFVAGDASQLPFPDGSFDAAVSTQVYEYLEDVPRALREARRVLRRGGRLLVLDTDWDSVVWHSSDPARMARLLDVWSTHLADPY